MEVKGDRSEERTQTSVGRVTFGTSRSIKDERSRPNVCLVVRDRYG